MVLRSEGIMTSGEGAMIVVDSSVWIDFFRGADTPGRHMLREVLQQDDPAIVVPDLVLYEVLRGFRHARDYANARRLLEGFDVVPAFNPGGARLHHPQCAGRDDRHVLPVSRPSGAGQRQGFRGDGADTGAEAADKGMRVNNPAPVHHVGTAAFGRNRG